MARKRILTRMMTKKGLPERWRTIHKGKIYYFRGDYEKCEAEWLKERAEILHHQEITSPNFRGKEYAEFLRDLEEEGGTLATHKKPIEQSKTIWHQIDNYLTQKQSEIKKEKLTPSSWYNKSVRLKHFTEYMGGDNDINDITEIKLTDFNALLVSKAKAGEMAWDYARDIMKSVIAFVQNRWENRQLKDLPRNLRNRDLSIPSPAKEIELFTKQEYLHLIEHAPDRMKLYLLMMLNIGATQKDIADLKQDEVDWKEGRIIRRRSKSQTAKKNTPIVNYKLWKNTFDLLKKLRSKDKTLVLLNSKGGSLRTARIEGKKLKFCDYIVADYKRLCESLGIHPKPLKLIRKTGASKLNEKYKYAQYYLAHSPTSIADKNYVLPTPTQFDKCLAWLGKQFFSTGRV